MNDLFISVLNMSLTASYVIAAIMLARLFLKKAPKIVSYALWAVAGFRLVFPFSFESVFSLIPFKSAPIPAEIVMQPIPRVDSGINFVDNAVSQVLPAATPTASVNPLQIWLTVGAYLWLTGIAVMLIYSVVSIVLLKRRLRGATLVQDNIYEADNLKTPFVLGLFRPKIYIPAGLTEEEKCYIILHERTHIRQHDHVVKFLAYFILSLHWFNPFAWAAFLLMGTDMEMSCDERVLKEMGGDIKKAYSTSLLSLATGWHLINGSPLAFGEGNIKRRIKNVLNFKKPTAWIIVLSVALVAVLSVGFATNRTAPDNSSDWDIYDFPNYLYDRATLVTEAQVYPPSFEAINSKLTNKEMEGGLRHGKKFTLVKQSGNDWRIVPFAEGRTFTSEALNLAVGESYTYTITPDMLAGKLDAGNYRIITDIWYANEQPPTVRIVWADFAINNHSLSAAAPPSQAAETQAEASDSVTFFVTTSPGKYTPLMSSTPGLRLDITYEGPTAQILYEAKTGGFLTWENSIITDLGESVSRPTDASALYWRPNLDTQEDDVITLSITNEAGEKIAGSTFTIAKGEDGIFTAFSKSAGNNDTKPSAKEVKIEPTSPELSLEQTVGVDMPRLDYASDDILIFHGYFGLFVYDLDSNQIIRSLDLKPLNCHQTQGGDACDVNVSMDGDTVQLHPMSSKNMIVYTVSSHTLQETTYQPMKERFSSLFVPIEDVIGSKKVGNYSYDAVKFDAGEYGYLETSDWTLGTLSYVRDDMIYKLFDTSTNIVYTEEEIHAAMECVRKYFAEEATFRVLNDLWFDEKVCITHRTSYMQYGKGKTNGVSEENVIVLLCNFTIENDATFKGYYPNWQMILIRDSIDGAWRIDDQGV